MAVSTMVYTQVVNNGMILPVKQKYTMRDVNRLVTESLFNPIEGRTLTEHDAVFIVKCSAIYHNTDYSETIRKYSHDNYVYTGMVIEG